MSTRGLRRSTPSTMCRAATAGSIESSFAQRPSACSYSSRSTPAPDARAGRDARRDAAGVHGRHADARARRAPARSASPKPRTRELAGGVGRLARGADEPEQARHVDDVRPPRGRRGCGSSVCVMRSTACRLIDSSHSTSSRLTSAKRPPSATPALLTSRCTCGCASAISSAAASAAARSARSTTYVVTARSGRAARSVGGDGREPVPSRSRSTRLLPRADSSCAVARPMPPAAPVRPRYRRRHERTGSCPIWPPERGPAVLRRVARVKRTPSSDGGRGSGARTSWR